MSNRSSNRRKRKIYFLSITVSNFIFLHLCPGQMKTPKPCSYSWLKKPFLDHKESCPAMDVIFWLRKAQRTRNAQSGWHWYMAWCKSLVLSLRQGQWGSSKGSVLPPCPHPALLLGQVRVSQAQQYSLKHTTQQRPAQPSLAVALLTNQNQDILPQYQGILLLWML